MGVKNFFTNEKAIIEVFDQRQFDQAAKGTLPGANGKIAATRKRDFKVLENFEKSLSGNKLDMFEQVASATKFQSFSGIDVKGMKKQFEVQFNPSDLQIEGYGGGRIATTAYNNPGKEGEQNSSSVTMMPMPVYVKMNVKLLFDRMDPSDSFLSAKTNMAASDIGRSVTKNAVKAATSKKLTVQQEVEGLIAALRSPFTRCITFYWGDMSYEGILNRVASQYTMFNSSGEPVRAVVQLSLVCADEKVSPNSLGAWQDAYKTAFGGGSQSLVSAGQKVGSLFNIGK